MSRCCNSLGSLGSVDGSVTRVTALSTFTLFLIGPSSRLHISGLGSTRDKSFFGNGRNSLATFRLGGMDSLRITCRRGRRLRDGLSFTFLLGDSMRHGTRHIATRRVHCITGRLRSDMNGVCSLLSLRLRLPLIRYLVTRLVTRNTLPSVPRNDSNIRARVMANVRTLNHKRSLAGVRRFLRAYSMLPSFRRHLGANGILTRVNATLNLSTSSLIVDSRRCRTVRTRVVRTRVTRRVTSPVTRKVVGGGRRWKS